MSFKKFKKRLQFSKQFEIYHPGGIYSGSIGYLTQSIDPEIILLSFGEKMLIYNKDGIKKQEIPFTSEVCKLFITENLFANEKVFVSLAYNGEIRVFSDTGDVKWKLNGDPIVDGVLGNLDYDPKLEIIALHKNKKITIYNDTGKLVAKYTHPERIQFISIAKLNSKKKNIILFVDRQDKLFVLDIEKNISEIPLKIKSIRALDSLTIYDTNVVVILDDTNYINLVDKKGNLIERFIPEKEIDTVFTGYLEDDKVESVFAISKDSYVLKYKIDIADAKEFVDSPTAVDQTSNIISQKVEQSVNPSLEVNANYFNQEIKPFPTPKGEGSTLQKTVIPKRSIDNLTLKCPECGDFLPRSLVQQIISGKDSFCEECGRPLNKSDYASELA